MLVVALLILLKVDKLYKESCEKENEICEFYDKTRDMFSEVYKDLRYTFR